MKFKTLVLSSILLFSGGLATNSLNNKILYSVEINNDKAAKETSDSLLPPQPIDEDDVFIEVVDITSNSAKINYSIDLHDNSAYEPTEIEHVILIGENENGDFDFSSDKSEDSFEIHDLNAKTSYSYDLFVSTNAAGNEIIKNFEFSTNQVEPITIDEDDVVLTETEITNESVKINYDITDVNALDPDDVFIDTKIESVDLLDGEDKLIASNDDNLFSGNFIIDDLENNTEYEYKIIIKTNASNSDSSNNIVTKESSFITKKGPIIQIKSTDIEVNGYDLNKGEQKTKIEWNVNLPADENYEETNVEDVMVYENGSVVNEGVRFDGKHNPSGSVEIINLEFGVTHHYQIGVKTNASEDYILSAESIEVTAEIDGPIQLNSDDIILAPHNPSQGEKIARIDWGISMPNDSTHEETIIKDVRLFEDDSEVSTNVEFTDKTSPTGTVTISNLEFGVTHHYQIGVQTNISDEYIKSEEVVIEAHGFDALQIAKYDIHLTAHRPDKGETTASIDWDITLANDGVHDRTLVEDIKLFDNYIEVPETNVEFTDKTSPTGTVTISNLEFGVEHNYTLRVKTNAGFDYIESSDEVRMIAEKADPYPLTIDDINLTANSPEFGNEVIINWDIDIKNDEFHEETFIEDIKLFENDVELTSDVEFTDKTSSTGTIKISNLELDSIHTYNIGVKTNNMEYYLASKPIVVQVGSENILEFNETEDYVISDDKISFYSKINGNPDLFKVRYENEEPFKLEFEEKNNFISKSHSSTVEYTIELSVNKEYNLNNFKTSTDGGNNWNNLTYDSLTSEDPDTYDKLGFDIDSNGVITDVNGEESGYELFDDNGHMMIRNSNNGDVFEPVFNTNDGNGFSWWIIVVISLLIILSIIGLIILVVLIIKRRR